jgi:hypothetical protein
MNSNFDYKLHSYYDKCITIIIIFILQKNTLILIIHFTVIIGIFLWL